MRLRALAALGLGGAVAAACKSTADSDGLVAAPMLEAPIASTSATPDASAEPVAHRPTVDPRQPRNMKCERQVECLPELATAPTWGFSSPYERCNPAPIGELGKFSPTETLVHRRTDANTCCYLAFVGCETAVRHDNMVIRGRPLRDASGQAIRAATGERRGWASAADREPNDESRAAFWAAAGADEHASVAEFSRLSLVLLGLGAPAKLVAAVHRAALDEIAHAQACFSIASRFAGRALGPGPLDVARGEADASFVALARSTLRDGCLGEAAAAIELAARADDEADDAIAATVRAMARDEERHAELAWRILGFVVEADPVAGEEAITEFLSNAAPKNALESDVLAAVVRPCAEALRARVRGCATPRSPREGDCAREG